MTVADTDSPEHDDWMPSDLKSLITEATRYARFTMKKCGSLAPIMMAATDQGTILFTPDKLSDTGAKDDFANKVRLITASYGASAVVLILESWITKAKADELLDTLTPPSESYDREEVVVLIGQAPQGNIQTGDESDGKELCAAKQGWWRTSLNTEFTASLSQPPLAGPSTFYTES